MKQNENQLLITYLSACWNRNWYRAWLRNWYRTWYRTWLRNRNTTKNEKRYEVICNNDCTYIG